MNKLQTKAYAEKIEGKLLAIASEEIADRDGDVISIDGWDLKSFKQNPVLMWLHMMDGTTLPIGRANNMGIRDIGGKKKLVFEPEFHDITEEAKVIKRMYEEGYLKAFSVGMIPKQWEKLSSDQEFPPRFKYTKQELVEVSAVPIPALPSATIINETEKKGFNMTIVKSFLKEFSSTTVDGTTTIKSAEPEKPVIEPPVKKDLENALEIKQGRVLSTKNENKIKNAVSILTEVLSALGTESDNQGEDKAVSTDERLAKMEGQMKHLIGEVQAYRKENKIEDKSVVSQEDLNDVLSRMDEITARAIEKATSKTVKETHKEETRVNLSFTEGGEK